VPAVGHPSDVAQFLKRVRLFERVAAADLDAVVPRLRARSLKKGQVLFRDGDPGEEMYLVRSGTMVVSKPVTGTVEQVLGRAGPGDFFGEMSLFDRAPRSATLQAETDAALLVLDRENLQRLVETSPAAAAEFFHALVHVFIARLRASTDLVAEVTRWGLEATGLDVEAP
jgi:CRP/FNR family transcriptional regulator, cyclic AMP receptor protein